MKAIIIEDEQMATNRLRRLVYDVNSRIEIASELTSVAAAVEYLKDSNPDLIFLDIQLSDGTAFDILSNATINSPIIFTTAYHEYAAQVLEEKAFDYLLKPIQRHELQSALNNFSKHGLTIRHALQSIPSYGDSCNMLIRFGSRYHLIKPHDIAYIYQKQGLTILVNYENETLPLNLSLADIVNKLDDKKLVFLSNAFLIHLDAIREILHLNKSQVEFVIYPPIHFPIIFKQKVRRAMNALSRLNSTIS